MGKAIRIGAFRAVPAPGLDGHRFELDYELGELVNGTFMPKQWHKLPVTTSGTLQAVWRKNNAEIETTSASAAVHYVTNAASAGMLDSLSPINLNTSTAPREPPEDIRIGPGSIIPIADTKGVQEKAAGFSILSDDLAELRDNINALASALLGERLLELPQERPILDVYKPVTNADEFRARVQSLATICVAINKRVLGRVLSKPDTEDLGSIGLLQEYLASICDDDRSAEICRVLKETNNLRKGYPAHGDNVDSFMRAHDFFRLRYPVTEFGLAWDTVLGSYFEAMKKLRDVLSDARMQRIGRGDAQQSVAADRER